AMLSAHGAKAQQKRFLFLHYLAHVAHSYFRRAYTGDPVRLIRLYLFYAVAAADDAATNTHFIAYKGANQDSLRFVFGIAVSALSSLSASRNVTICSMIL